MRNFLCNKKILVYLFDMRGFIFLGMKYDWISKRKTTCFHKWFLAEKERFELSNRFTGYTISNRAPSTN